MQFLLAPGIALMNRLSTPQKMLVMIAAFSLPLAVAVAVLGAWRDPALLLIGAGYLLALYSTLGHHLQVKTGFGGLREAVQRFASGDLDYRSEGTGRGEIGGLLQHIKTMSASLAGIFERVRASAEVIDAAAREIAAGHLDLSQRTEEQASTLEETASGMEELAVTVRQNAESCETASTLARSAGDVAQRGAGTVTRAVERMGMIDRSSRKIADIVGVIEGIAFQTSILALNAAVEAARAGEQGRGFAVVASDVRVLAQRSAQAAKEIKALIEESAVNVAEGGKLVAEAGGIIDEIVASLREVTEIVGLIAVASRQQSAGVQEINNAIVQMEGVTQQNAALVEQVTASTLAFEEQTANLLAIAGRFKFAARARPATQSAAPVRPAPVRPAPRRTTAPRLTLAARPAIAAKREDEWKEF
jgi:methyl-accepting chemotaxis protein